MTVTAEQAAVSPAGAAARCPLARPAETDWPTTRRDRAAVWVQLSGSPFGTDKPGSRHRASHPAGLAMALDWLEDQPGTSWQDRWLASGADEGNGAWRQAPLDWLHARGYYVTWQEDAFFRHCGSWSAPT